MRPPRKPWRLSRRARKLENIRRDRLRKLNDKLARAYRTVLPALVDNLFKEGPLMKWLRQVRKEPMPC